MSFFKNIFGKKETPIKSYSDFWNWFKDNEKEFFSVVKAHTHIEKDFFDKLSPKLAELKEGYFYLTGMYNDDTVELILTADGNPKNMVFVEELVAEAPNINGWKFTAFKPATDIEDIGINMNGYRFDKSNLFFYANEKPHYPDEIDICVIHNDRNEENKQEIGNGIYIFLDNYLGEIDFLNNIDNLQFISKNEAEKELVPIAKLKDFLTWRQKEFIEKYEGVRYETPDDEYSIIEAELESGNNLIAVINTQLLKWDRKASHPWIAVITFQYDGNDNNGMPYEDDFQNLDEIEEKILEQLQDKDGYLYIGRQTANNERDIYFACKDIRKPSKVFYQTQIDNANKYEVSYDIYKDKYWQSFERFSVS
ncbi:MAG: DUF695 domain-containing protein [Bacteroidia bacterium]|nr:DUF695 domain-containing protein [Bacteroidia bacterium]